MSPFSRGQALAEFLVVSAALMIALLLPVMNGRSIARILLEAVLATLQAQTYLISIL